MALEVQSGSTRETVIVSWDMDVIDGEFVQLHCVNPETGDKSQSAVSKNDGTGQVSYPEGYTGKTEITVIDNHENSETGVILVTEDGAITIDPDAHPEHPIELPDEPIEPDPDAPHPEHPIAYPPGAFPGDPGFNPPPSEVDVPHPNPNE